MPREKDSTQLLTWKMEKGPRAKECRPASGGKHSPAGILTAGQ